jgi:hypothetical protein
MRTIIVASLGLNAVLLGALAFVSVRQPSKSPAESAPPPEPVQIVPRRERPAQKSTAIANLASFRWSQLESSDYHQYMANLRGVGCPEETIRDLIIAEVDKMFAPRFAALAGESQTFQHWRRRSKASENLVTQLRALQDERKGLLRELLGIDDGPYAKWANADVARLQEEGKYSFLSAEKQAQVRAIMEKYQQQIDGGQNGRDGFVISGGDETKRLREQRQQELAQLLSPEELKELSLRDSNAADSVRGRFGNLDITEDEYRKLYDLRKGYEDTVGAVADVSDPEKMRQRSEARRQLDEAYRNVFGEERWNDLQKQQDPTWRGLTQIAQQNNLSQTVIDQAYQYQRQTGEQVMRAIEDRSLSREQREAMVQQLTGEYDRTLQGILGDQAFQKYKQTNPGFSFTSGSDSFSFVGPAGGPVPAGGGPRTIDIQNNGGNLRTRVQIAP